MTTLQQLKDAEREAYINGQLEKAALLAELIEAREELNGYEED